MSDLPASGGPPGPAAFATGQLVTVFRSRVRPEAVADYESRAAEVLDLALGMPGLVDVKSFSAADGEHVTIATFADEPSQQAWREHTEHRLAQHAGRDRFYAAYTLQVCETVRARSFAAGCSTTG
jgi:heme-degrading monooxygenase HmoA